jgi:two-component system chemotaxis sensor kinase CheA
VLRRLAESAPVAAAMTGSGSEDPVADNATSHVWKLSFECPAQSNLVANVLTELAGLGTLTIIDDPRCGNGDSTATKWVLLLQTPAGVNELRELFSFVIDTDVLQIKKASKADQKVVSTTPPQANSTDECYGFFEALPVSTEVDQGYGFFEELQPIPDSTAAAQGDSLLPVSGPGRRATDKTNFVEGKNGRRESDKLIATQSPDSSSIRVSVEKVDQLINLVGELVITQAMLAQTASKLDPKINETLCHGMAQLERNTRDLQESVMSIRMMPIAFVFSRYPRVVRDLASKLNKQVELKTVGENTELDKGVIEKISDPLTHLVRNSLDHGIESPEERVAAGKPAKGTICLRAFHQGGNIVIEVSDDGAGLNRAKLLAKARERGIPVNDNMNDQDVFDLIFEAGFSTAAVVTDVSGRGVGMDVVRKNIQGMGGRVEISSSLGQGTRIAIRLPLTLAILDGMSVAVSDEVFIVPLTNIIESLQPKASDINTVHNKGILVHVRGEYLPVVKLHEIFNIEPKVTQFDRGIMVILESDGIKKALFVDELLGQHQVVIKSLETNYRKVVGVSGATIMGDGKVALILDAGAVIRETRRDLRLVA